MDRYLDVDASDADAVARKNQTKELRRGLEEARNKAKLLSGGKVKPSMQYPSVP